MFKNFCHDQVRLLLERMDSNPEEFLHHHKWNPFLPNMHHVTKGTSDYFPSFNPLERALITRKFNRLCEGTMRQHAYNRILEVAIAGEEKEVIKQQWVNANVSTSSAVLNTNAISLGGISTSTWSNIISPPALTIGNTTLTEKDLKKIKGRFWGLL